MLLRRIIYALAGLAVLAVALVLVARAVLASDLVRSALEQQLSAWLGEPVRIGEARASLTPRVSLDLRNITVGDPPAVELGSVRVVTGIRGLLARRVVDAEVVVADSRMELPLPFAIVAAAPRLTEEEPAPDRAFTIESIRTIEFRNVRVTGNGRELSLDMTSSIEGDRLHVAAMSVGAAASRIEASGELTSIDRMQGRFDARASRLDVAEMVAIASALGERDSATVPAGRDDGADAPHFVVALTAPAARFGSWDARDVTTMLDITPGRLVASPLALGLAGGTVSGRVDVDTSSPTPHLRMTGRLEGVTVEELMGPEGAPGGITGRLGADVSLSASGTDPEAVLKTARGQIRAAITDGSIPGMDMVRTIVLAFGRPDGAPPEGSGSVFSRLGGAFALADGTMRTDDLAMASRDFDLAGTASFNLISRAVDATVDVVLSRELTAQAGTDLRRLAQEDGRVIIPARVTGTLDRAIVTPDLAAAARRAIGGELRRRTRSLLDDLLRQVDPR